MLHAICSMACDLFSDKRNQGHNPGFFDGIRKTPLVTRTSPVSFRWIDLALRIHKAPDKIGVLEINFVHFALAKKTRFFFNFGDDIIFIIHYILVSHSVDCASAIHVMGYALCD